MVQVIFITKKCFFSLDVSACICYDEKKQEKGVFIMDFTNIPVNCYPAYSWIWNTKITAEEIHRQVDEMYDAGIRAFYAIPMPKNFRQAKQKTYLSPEYLSDEYMDMLYEAYSYAKQKGMYTWLYNEGGWPSGMACGIIRQEHPELGIMGVEQRRILLRKNIAYEPADGTLATFREGERIHRGYQSDEDTELIEYYPAMSFLEEHFLLTDIANPRTVELFLECTHEKMKKRFKEAMGTDVTIMFDDEAHMGIWTSGMEKMFYEMYGYDICDYLPYVFNRDKVTYQTELQKKVFSDYRMLCCKLMKENYFTPMRKWLNKNSMLSSGHLVGEESSTPFYGNILSVLRTFDIPGIDTIWSQITYPVDGKCVVGGYDFFPTLASSAARQQGHHLCMSESFSVNGAHTSFEEMRFVINFQAVRGISLFNFIGISFDRLTPMMHQFRPNFIPENPGMDALAPLNDYTARISYILQSTKADIKTALYFPQRSTCAFGEIGKQACQSYEELGHMLEKKGVAFDVIDEEFVENAAVRDGKLCGEFVTYENVFVPVGELEHEAVMEKLAKVGSELVPMLEKTYASTLSRHLLFDDADEGYFICSFANETVQEAIALQTDKTPYLLDLETGELSVCDYEYRDGKVHLELELVRGAGAFVYLSEKELQANHLPQLELCATVADFSSFISRRYELDAQKGTVNTYYEDGARKQGLGEWEQAFSGEVTYLAALPELPDGDFVLDLGEVRHSAKVYLNGERIGAVIMPPYRIALNGAKTGDELKIVVANTAANEILNTDYFDRQPACDVGPYHKIIKEFEKKAPAGGLLGPVRIFKKSGI